MTDPGDEPRVFSLSNFPFDTEEIPLEFLRWRRTDIPDSAEGVPIAPGVRVRLMSTGDHMLPDGSTRSGALIAVWVDDPDITSFEALAGWVHRNGSPRDDELVQASAHRVTVICQACGALDGATPAGTSSSLARTAEDHVRDTGHQVAVGQWRGAIYGPQKGR
jgi:hypothetical protein